MPLNHQIIETANQLKICSGFFYKQIVVDDETIISTEAFKVPGYIGIANSDIVTDPDNKQVSGHDDVVKFLDEYGLLICTYIYNKDRYGQLLDLRWALGESDQEDLMEMIIKGGGHHAGAIRDNVPQLDNKTNVKAPQEIEDSKHPFKTAAFSW